MSTNQIYPLDLPTRTNPNNNPQTTRLTWQDFSLMIACALGYLTILTLVAAVLFFVAWILYIICIPNPTLPQFKVESVTLSQLNTEGSLNTTWDITLTTSNTDRRYILYYDSLHAGVRYQLGDTDVFISRTPQLHPLALKGRNHKRISFKVDVVMDGVPQQIGAYDRSGGLVKFAVRIIAQVRFKAKLIPASHQKLLILCHPVDFGFSGNNETGVLTSHSGGCSIQTLYYY